MCRRGSGGLSGAMPKDLNDPKDDVSGVLARDNPLHGHAQALDPHADRRAWVAPLLSTLVTLPGALVALAYTMLAPMACDSCSDADSARFDTSFHPAFHGFLIGLVVPLGLLLASWGLPWQQRNAARRLVLAPLAPGAVVLLAVLFTALVDWPR